MDPDAGRPGLGGLVGGWARLTKSSPDESDSLSFHRELSFFKFHIMGYFEVLVGCVPELVSIGTLFITNEDHSSALWL